MIMWTEPEQIETNLTTRARTMLAAMPRAVDTHHTEDRLRRFEAIADTGLAHLREEDVLKELLDRVRDVLEADTATVLLLDNTGQQLVAAASSGLEEEVRRVCGCVWVRASPVGSPPS